VSPAGSDYTVEGLQPVATLPRTGARVRMPSVLGWGRDRATTTPGKLALISILVIAGAVAFGVIATVAVVTRGHAARAARSQTEPLLRDAVTLYTSLADANAQNTVTFHHGGLEPAGRRLQYVNDLNRASDSLATLARKVGAAAGAPAAVRTVTQGMPVYAGYIEDARANNRQQFPVGAAYLRAASSLLTRTILPAAGRLYTIEAVRLGGDYGTGTATGPLAVLVVVAVLALGLLVWAQVFLARVTRRVFNVPMLLATLVLAGTSIWAVAGLLGERSALTRAQRDGSDPVQVVSATSALVSRALTDASLIAVNHGTDDVDPKDLIRMIHVLAPPAGLFVQLKSLAGGTVTTSAADQLQSEFATFRSDPSKATPAETLHANLQTEIDAAHRRFVSAAADATSSVSGLSIAVPVLIAIAAALALLGLRQRLGEYR
jgi:hypothetical protein